jgi:hypothetical protein
MSHATDVDMTHIAHRWRIPGGIAAMLLVTVGAIWLYHRGGSSQRPRSTYAERADAVRVPNAAIPFRPPAELAGPSPPVAPPGKKLVCGLRADNPTAVVFEPGVRDSTYTEVLGGLAVGDRVVAEAIGGAGSSSVGRIL